MMNTLGLKVGSVVFAVCFLSIAFFCESDASPNKEQLINSFLQQWALHAPGYESYFDRLKKEGDHNAVQHLMDMGLLAFVKKIINSQVHASKHPSIIFQIYTLPIQMRMPNEQNFMKLQIKAKVPGLMKK